MTANIKLNMDDAEVQKSLDEQRKKNEAVEKSYVGVAKQILKNERQAVNAAKRIIKGQRDEKQILSDKIKALRTLGQTDSSQKQAANTAIKKLIAAEKERRQSIEETESASTEAGQALRAQIDTGIRKTKELIAAEQTLDQKFDELRLSIKAAFDAGKIGPKEMEVAIASLNKKQTEAVAKSREAGEANKKSFGSSAIQGIKTYAASFASIAGAIGIVTKAIQFFNEEKERALGTTDSLVDTRRSLRQISKGDFNELEQRADSLASNDALGISREQARQLVFDARSTGFEGEEGIVAAADPVIEITDGAAFAGEFRKFFSQDSLSIEQSFNTALAGAAESQFNISQLLPQLRTAAQGALAGGESSDVVAATSVLASNFGRSTGDRLRALGTKIATNEDTAGLNLIDAVRKIQGDDQLRESIIKDSAELKAVFGRFSERLGEIVAADKRIEAEQQQSGDGGLIQKAINEARDNDIEVARRINVASEQRRRIAEELVLSADAARGVAAQSDVVTDSFNRGDSGVDRFVAATASEAARRVGASPEVVSAAGAGAINGKDAALALLTPLAPLTNLIQSQINAAAGAKAESEAQTQLLSKTESHLRTIANRSQQQLQGVD